MDTATRVQILDENDCFSHSTNIFGKSMNPIILPPAMGKIVGQTGFFSLVEATSLGEGKLWIQTCYTPLKNWPCVISCPSGVGVNMINLYSRQVLKTVLSVWWMSWWTWLEYAGVYKRQSLKRLIFFFLQYPAYLLRLLDLVSDCTAGV